MNRTESVLEEKAEAVLDADTNELRYAKKNSVPTSTKVKYISIGFAIGVGATAAAFAARELYSFYYDFGPFSISPF